MDRNRLQLFRRTVCAVCAFALVLTLAGPAAFAANKAAPAETELTQAQAAEMAQADAALDQLLPRWPRPTPRWTSFWTAAATPP